MMMSSITFARYVFGGLLQSTSSSVRTRPLVPLQLSARHGAFRRKYATTANMAPLSTTPVEKIILDSIKVPSCHRRGILHSLTVLNRLMVPYHSQHICSYACHILRRGTTRVPRMLCSVPGEILPPVPR